MILDSKIEEKLIEIVKKLSLDGYRFYHALAAVYWIRQLIKKGGGDEMILVPTMYLHDIGYKSTRGKENTHESYQAAKESHMIVGAQMAEEILKEMNFKPDKIKEIVHLISVHDKLELLSSFNEQLVFEADSLSGIDREKVKSNFSKEEYEKYLKSFEDNRMPLFKTETGKEALKKLWPIAKNYFQNS